MTEWIYTPSCYEDADAADGPMIVQWLGERGLLEKVILKGDSVDRRIRAWRQGERPSFFTADKYLAAFDVHPSELPDDVWLSRRVENIGVAA